MKRIILLSLLIGASALADTTNTFTVVLSDRTETVLTLAWKLNNWRLQKDGQPTLTKKAFAEQVASQALHDAAERYASDMNNLLIQRFQVLTDEQKLSVLNAATP